MIIPVVSMAARCGARSAKLEPLRNNPLTIMRKWVSGITSEIYWKNSGIFSTGKTKPDR